MTIATMAPPERPCGRGEPGFVFLLRGRIMPGWVWVSGHFFFAFFCLLSFPLSPVIGRLVRRAVGGRSVRALEFLVVVVAVVVL